MHDPRRRGIFGVTAKTQQRTHVLQKISGGILDKGIHFRAQRAFANWVRRIRGSLGAKRDGQIIFVSSPRKLKRAVNANKQHFLNYKRIRDAEEFAVHGRRG